MKYPSIMTQLTTLFLNRIQMNDKQFNLNNDKKLGLSFKILNYVNSDINNHHN